VSRGVEVESFSVPPLGNTVYLVYDPGSKEAALIDTSCGASVVLPRVAELGLSLKHVLNTHGHADHVADNAAVAKATGAKVGIHEADAYRLELVARESHPYLAAPPPPSKPDLVLKEGTVVRIGGSDLRVLHTPGHTEGSVSFHLPEARCLFSGDTLLAGAFGSTAGLGSSPARLWRSLERIHAMPPETRVLPGHGPPTRVGDEAWVANLRYAAPH